MKKLMCSNEKMRTRSKQKISVVLCVFNGASFLRQQLDSIAMQNVQPDELIISDDCSTDATVDIAYEFKRVAKFPVSIRINKINLGYLKNFESAASTAKYDFVFFSDQDDIWRPDKIKVFMDTFNTHDNCGYVFSDAMLIDSKNNLVGESLWSTIGFNSYRRKKYSTGMQLEVMLKNGNFVYGNGLAFRNTYRDLIYPMPNEGSSNVVSHDVWISLVLSLTGAYGIAVPKTCYSYRQHSQQVVGAQMKTAVTRLVELEHWTEWVHLYKALLAKTNDISSDPGSRQQVQQKIRHLEARLEISKRFLIPRVILASRELLTFRYFRFSRGFLSWCKDIYLEPTH
jgi:glycosyltransferase involved in cell wall biosynthesis